MFNFVTGIQSGGEYSAGAGTGWNSGPYSTMKALANDAELMQKSMTTGEGVINAGNATSGQPLRVQFLHNVLELTSYSQDDAAMMKRIPKKKVYSNTFEWSQFNLYGGAGDGFISETGASTDQSSGLFFGASATDDTFTRLVRQLKFLASVRFVSLPTQHVKNIEDPMRVSEKGMTLEIIGKTDVAIYWADSKKSATQFDGLERQLTDWLTSGAIGSAFAGHPEDQAILYDMGGAPLDKSALAEIQATNSLLWGNGTLLMTSLTTYEDTQRLLYPEQRFGEGVLGSFGVNKDKFVGSTGTIQLAFDRMLRANRPLTIDGPGGTGLPRTTATADTGAPALAATPFLAASSAVGVQNVAAGSGLWWDNVSLNTDTVIKAIPALPSGAGNQGNRSTSVAANYYYAVSAVYQGKESAAYIYGAGGQAADTISGSPTLLAPTAGQVVQLEFDISKITIGGAALTSANANLVKLRVYRYGGAGAVAPTKLSQFSLLCSTGLASAANINGRCFDNGMWIPGADTAFLITEKKNGSDGWMLAQLLPLMRRMGLPELLMASPLAMLYFCAPILLAPRHHMEIRNIGRM